MKMNRYILNDSSTACKELLKSINKFSLLLINGLIKGLSPNYGIFSTFLVEVHYYIVHSDSKLQEEYF